VFEEEVTGKKKNVPNFQVRVELMNARRSQSAEIQRRPSKIKGLGDLQSKTAQKKREVRTPHMREKGRGGKRGRTDRIAANAKRGRKLRKGRRRSDPPEHNLNERD